MDEEPDLTYWVQPERDAAAERASLKAHTDLAKGLDVSLGVSDRESCSMRTDPVLYNALRARGRRHQLPVEKDVRLRDLPVEDIVRVLTFVEEVMSRVDDSHSPGFPYLLQWPTNKAFFEAWGRFEIADLFWQRLRSLSRVKEDRRFPICVDPVALHQGPNAEASVHLNMCDPIRVFVKNELHSQAKAAQGRWRLIMSVSIIDSMVERYLSADFNETMIDTVYSTAYGPGLGHDDESIRCTVLKLAKTGYEYNGVASSDVSMFDWSVSYRLLALEACARSVAMVGLESPKHALLRAHRTWHLARALFVLRDGTAYAQRKPGVQKSGSYNTSSANSVIRAHLAGPVTPCLTMGDDCVEGAFEDLVKERERRVELHGFRPKDYQFHPFKATVDGRSVLVEFDGVDFCGHLYGGVVRVYKDASAASTSWEVLRAHACFKRPAKALANCLNSLSKSKQHNRELVDGLAYTLRSVADRERFVSIASGAASRLEAS